MCTGRQYCSYRGQEGEILLPSRGCMYCWQALCRHLLLRFCPGDRRGRLLIEAAAAATALLGRKDARVVKALSAIATLSRASCIRGYEHVHCHCQEEDGGKRANERGKTTQHIAFSPPLPHARVKKNVCSLDSPACKQRNSRLGAQYPVQYPRKRGFYPRRKMTPWHERQIAKICHLRLAGWKGEGELEDL